MDCASLPAARTRADVEKGLKRLFQNTEAVSAVFLLETLALDAYQSLNDHFRSPSLLHPDSVLPG